MLTFFRDPTVIAVIIGAAVSLISLSLNIFVSLRTRRLADFLEVTKSSLEFKKRQLDEFYGPILALTRQSTHLARRIRDAEGTDFHLLEHLPETLSRLDIGPIANLLLENNEKIETLLLTKSSLLDSYDFPDSFTLFLGHCGILRSAVTGQPLDNLTSIDYYPKEFDADIEYQFKKLKQEVDVILESRTRLLGNLKPLSHK